jgi:hypothetical protein
VISSKASTPTRISKLQSFECVWGSNMNRGATNSIRCHAIAQPLF